MRRGSVSTLEPGINNPGKGNGRRQGFNGGRLKIIDDTLEVRGALEAVSARILE